MPCTINGRGPLQTIWHGVTVSKANPTGTRTDRCHATASHRRRWNSNDRLCSLIVGERALAQPEFAPRIERTPEESGDECQASTIDHGAGDRRQRRPQQQAIPGNLDFRVGITGHYVWKRFPYPTSERIGAFFRRSQLIS